MQSCSRGRGRLAPLSPLNSFLLRRLPLASRATANQSYTQTSFAHLVCCARNLTGDKAHTCTRKACGTYTRHWSHCRISCLIYVSFAKETCSFDREQGLHTHTKNIWHIHTSSTRHERKTRARAPSCAVFFARNLTGDQAHTRT